MQLNCNYKLIQYRKIYIIISIITLLIFCNIHNTQANLRSYTKKIYKSQIYRYNYNRYTFTTPFIKNVGQIKNKNIVYYTNTINRFIGITKKGQLIYMIKDIRHSSIKNRNIIEELLNAKITNIEGYCKTKCKINYLIGSNKKNWKVNVKSYKYINMGEIYPGITFLLTKHNSNIDKLFIIKPNGDPNKLIFKLKHIKYISISSKGRLKIYLSDRVIYFNKPTAYQIQKGRKIYINIKYLKINNNTYKFVIDKYNRNKNLIIDPLIASTYFGGNGDDIVKDMTLDKSGNIYIVGWTNSNNLPTTNNSYQKLYINKKDIFIAKFNNNLTKLLALTYLGGNNNDEATAIVIDKNNDIYITGCTNSNNFPITNNAYNKKLSNTNIFVAKLNSNLSKLLASTYISGDYSDRGTNIAIDKYNNIYIAAFCSSNNMPVFNTSYLSYNYSGFDKGDVYIAKLNSNLSKLLASTYLGGNGNDVPTSLVIGKHNNIYVAGFTGSYDFPTTIGAYDRTFNCNLLGSYNYDGFICKLDPQLSSLLASTYLGGSNSNYIFAMTIDKNNNVYVTGQTYSRNFPTTKNAYNKIFTGGNDSYAKAFVSKFNQDLSKLIASTYLGGSVWWTSGNTITVDNKENVYVAGFTQAYDFPITSNAYDIHYQQYKGNSNYEGFVSKFNNQLSKLLDSTFFGTKQDDSIKIIKIGPKGNIFLTGYTRSQFFPTTNNAFDKTYNGRWEDIFISELDPNLSSDLIPQISQFKAIPTSGIVPLSTNFICEVYNPSGTKISYNWDFDGDGKIDQVTNSNSIEHTYTTAGHYRATVTIINSLGNTIKSKAIIINAYNKQQKFSDITNLLNIKFSHRIYDRFNRCYLIYLTIKNRSEHILSGPIRLIIINPTVPIDTHCPLGLRVAGKTSTGNYYFIIIKKHQTLSPNESIKNMRINFKLKRTKFDFKIKIEKIL